MTPTYGNTLMGLACSEPVTKANGYKISYYAPQPRAVIEVVDFDETDRLVDYGRDGPREADHPDAGILCPRLSGARRRRTRTARAPKYPWDGVSGVRPFSRLADATTVGVY